jgi:hypothetical protein
MFDPINHVRSSYFRRGSTPACLAAAMVAVVGVPASRAVAQDYLVTHNFDVNTRGNLAPHLALKHHEYAYARCGRAKDKAENRAIDVIGLGVTTFTETATAGTVSVANSRSNVTTLAVGNAVGVISVFGDVDLCDVSVSRSAYGRAFSAARLYYRGQGMDRRGRIGWVGSWRAEPGIQGGIGKVRRIDPIIGRVFDRTTGTMTEHLLLDIENFVQDGAFAWENDRVTNSARTMELRITMPGDVTTGRGRLVIRVENGTVIESEASGVYAGAAVPPVGSGAAFGFDLSSTHDIEFDMPGDDAHDLDVEIEMGGAGEHDEAAGALAGDVYITTALDKGPDFAPIYEAPTDAALGVPIIPGELSVAQPFLVSPEQIWTADDMMLRVIQPGADPDQPLEAVVVRLWQGAPGPTGRVIAGDLDTNRLVDTQFTGIYAVNDGDESSERNPVQDALVDLSWLPPLAPGRYFIEVAAVGTTPEPVLLPPSPFQPSGQWQPALLGFGGVGYEPLVGHDGNPASAPMLLFGDDGVVEPCRVDLDGDGRLTIFDFLAFQNLFASGDPFADFDGDGRLTIFDFLAFQNEFVAGCP